MFEIETKRFLATLATPSSLTGVLLLAGALLLFRFTLFGPDLSHLPLLDAALTKAQRWKAFQQEEEAVYLRGYNQVFAYLSNFASMSLNKA